jgi:tetratricopeptide (TPR) repeat protein
VGCLDETTVALLVDRRLDGAELATAQAHLDDCDACRAVIAELVRQKPIAEGSTAVARPAHRRAPSPDPALGVGDRIGRYVVLDVLGAGGMGTVYAAFDPDLDRKIALKLLRRGAGAADVDRTRMQREAQALARVSDPGVVAVHDVGTHGDQIFIAMEFVPGGTLTGWLRERARSWHEIVGILVGAGKGLAAAHAAGLVHRDVKPDNILVDRTGRARIGDFGLAFAAAERASQPRIPPVADGDAAGPVDTTVPDAARAALDASLTRTGTVVGTPAYMAPEQLSGQVVTARSDQFSFCATVYEALYGVRPYPGGSLDAIAAAMRARRIADPPADRGVPGYVRAAVLRGLAIDPTTRHPSMDALLAALDRAPGRRRWIAITAAVGALGAAATAAALVVAGADPAPCGGGEAELAAVWNPAQAGAIRAAFAAVGPAYAADTAGAVIAELDRHGAAWVAGQRRACEDTRVRRIADEAALALRMDCYAMHRRRFGAVVDALARADAAVVPGALDAAASLGVPATCDDVAALRQAVPPPTEPTRRATVAALAVELAVLEGVGVATGETAELRARLETAVETARAVDHPPLLGRALLQLAMVRHELGDQDGPPGLLRDAIAAADRGRDDRTRFLALAALISVTDDWHHPEAAKLLSQAEAALTRIGPDPRIELQWANVRAKLYLGAGEPAKATALYLDIVERLRPTAGDDGAQLADPLMNASFALTMYAPPAEALAMVRRAIAIYTKHWGLHHPKTANARGQEVMILEQLGQHAEAYTIQEEVLADETAAFGPSNPRVATSLGVLAQLSRLLGRYDDAIAHYARCREMRVALLGPDHPQLAEVELGLAQIAVERRDPTTALPHVDAAERIVVATLGAADPFMAAVHHVRGFALQLRGDFVGALAAFRRGYDVERAVTGDDAPQLAEALSFIAGALLELGRAGEAATHLERALAMREAIEADAADLAGIRYLLARACAALGDRGEALHLLALALPVMATKAEPHDYAAATALAARLRR